MSSGSEGITEMERDDIKEEEEEEEEEEGEERKSQFESLYQIAVKGNVNEFCELLQKYPLILDQVMSDCVAKDNHPLHIGALFGHVEFVREILNLKPELTREMNSQELSPLHLASEKGHVEVVTLLLDIDADVCFLRDAEGRTPLHLAAMKGRVKVLEKLIHAKKIAAWILTKKREPILHICAKHGQFKALKMLVNSVREKDFVNLTDSDDNTILHVLTAMKELEVIKYLIDEKTGLDVNSMNVHGSTAMDVLEESNLDKPTKKIRKLLRRANGKLARKISQTAQSQPHKRSRKLPPKSDENKRNEIGQGLMVVAILIATLTFQAMASPPGGFWDEDGFHNKSTVFFDISNRSFYYNTSMRFHKGGTAKMSSQFQHAFYFIETFNTIGFVASLILIVQLVYGYSLQETTSVRALTVTTLIAVSSMFVSFTTIKSTINLSSPYSYRDFYFSPYGNGSLVSTPLYTDNGSLPDFIFTDPFYLSPPGDWASLFWFLVVAFMGYLPSFFHSIKSGIKDLFGLICPFKDRKSRHSDFCGEA